MPTLSSLVLTASPFLVVCLAWRFLRNFIVRSPLDNLPGPKPSSLLSGDMGKLFAHDSFSFHEELVDTYGPVSRIKGFLGERVLHVYDVKALHSVFVKDQDTFIRRNDVGEIVFGPGLLSTSGDRHKRQRKLLNPAFSTAHMRDITPFFNVVARKLRSAIETRVQKGDQVLDMVGWMGRTALELIGQGGFGHSFDPLVADVKDEYTQAVKEFLPVFIENSWVMIFAPLIPYLGPAWFRRKLLDLVPFKGVQHMKRISDTMHQRSVDIYNGKLAAMKKGDEALLEEVAEGKDIISILLKENMNASEEDKLPDDEILGQMSSFILAGVDTTSNALARVLHLLCLHKDVQETLRSELVEAHKRHGEEIPFDELMQLPYLDAVCRETLRLYAPVAFSGREARQDALLPLSAPIKGVDGKMMQEVVVPKGTLVLANLKACNTDKALWGDDARAWKPERWLGSLPKEVEEARIPGIYANLMTFINGSYSCIGFKFSQLEMKVVLSVLALHFRFSLSDKPFTWNFAGVAYPAANKDSIKPEMYLKVEVVSGE